MLLHWHLKFGKLLHLTSISNSNTTKFKVQLNVTTNLNSFYTYSDNKDKTINHEQVTQLMMSYAKTGLTPIEDNINITIHHFL